MTRVVRTMAIALTLGVLPMTAGLAAAIALNPNSVAGIYTKRFQNALVTGEKYTATNRLVIIPTGPKTAFISTELSFYNAHECGLEGMATVEGAGLVYVEKKVVSGGRQCTLRIKADRTQIRMEDEENSCSAYCGVRGSFHTAAFPIASRRQLRAADRAAAAPDIKRAQRESE